MATVVQPMSFIIRFPLDGGPELMSKYSVPNPDFTYEAARPSAISLDISHRPGRHGYSVIQFPILLDLGHRFQHIRELQLRDVAVDVHPNISPTALAQLPRFALLESLSIISLSGQPSRAEAVTNSLVRLFPHMPRLRSLTVLARPMHPLTKFVCVGALSIRLCAHIVTHSANTLDELRVGSLTFDDKALLISALARAAPRLRSLDLGLGMRADSVPWRHVKSVFGALARVERVHLETPQALHEALDLLRGLVSLRELSLWCMLDWHEQSSAAVAAVEQVIASLLIMPSLRSVTLYGFNVGDEERDVLIELCRMRRIRCSIID